MNNPRQQNSTSYPILFLMVDSTDHITPKTGLTPTVTLSKNGGSFGSASGAVSEIGNGIYALAGNTTDRNTLGSLMLYATATGADKTWILSHIVNYDPFTTIGTNLDVVLSTRLATSGYTAPDNTSITAIKAKTDNLPTVPASKSDVDSLKPPSPMVIP